MTEENKEAVRSTSYFLKSKVAEAKSLFVPISNRIADDSGKPVIFEFAAITPAKLKELETMNQKAVRDKYQRVIDRELDAEKYTLAIAIESCVYPDFRSAELIKDWGVKSPEALFQAMLYVGGEQTRFKSAALKVNEIGEEFEAVVDEAKNE